MNEQLITPSKLSKMNLQENKNPNSSFRDSQPSASTNRKTGVFEQSSRI